MAVIGNFFSNLRSLAITLEKETAHIEQVFSQEENEYEDESPMRMLHDLRSEMMELKTDIQGTIDKTRWKGQEVMSFMKMCKVLQQRNASDLQQIKDTFQKYGYKPLDGDASDNEMTDETENGDENNHNTDPQAPPPPPALDKQPAWDLMRVPQLSDFGLSRYQLPSAWEPQSNKMHVRSALEVKPEPSYKEICSVQVAKTPKCALTMEDDDFSQIQHFGISDYNTKLNDDYTLALMNKKKGSGPEKSKDTSRSLKTILATPAHLTYKNDFSNVDSPLAPVFYTPGLKVHKKRADCGLQDGDSEIEHHGSAADVLDDAATLTSSTRDMKCHFTLPAYQSLRSDREIVDSPHPPKFCTPGLKVHKKDLGCGAEKSLESKGVVERLDTPPVPSFETKWLNSDTMARSLDITEPIPRPELSHNVYLEEAVQLVLKSDKHYGNPTKAASPPKMWDFQISTPPRPEMTTSLTEDLFKYNMKLASPPKVKEYENLLKTPVRPEMTSCMTEAIPQISQYGKAKPSWDNPQGTSIGKGGMENKENRP
ncbi:spindle and kinetochore-associated protein 3 [Pseudophryne corroboree]|uniref:spindle and kinetochore-associated protein 3 n=1 Tax=Pseudophryne corroboree TaxID=495146 RepID=UPI00308126D3